MRQITQILLFFVLLLPKQVFGEDVSSSKSTDGDEVVRPKLFPKTKKIELNVPNFGTILNQSYLNTFIVGGGLGYFWSESWGISADFFYAVNQNKAERECIESFYNNFEYNITGEECASQNPKTDDELRSAGANYGPAYVPIREIKYMFALNGTWNPVYGKQIMFLSVTNYFDLFVNFGAGLAFSTYYPLSTELRNGRKSRGVTREEAGAYSSETDANGKQLIGIDGRPDPQEQMNIMTDVGIGQKFHFAKRFHVKAEIRNFTLLGTPQGFDTFFALYGGFGVRF